MKWSELRKLYPNKFVLIESISECTNDNYKYISEVKLIKVIEDDKTISELLLMCKFNRFVYHTSKEEVYIEIVKRPILRRYLR